MRRHFVTACCTENSFATAVTTCCGMSYVSKLLYKIISAVLAAGLCEVELFEQAQDRALKSFEAA